ncbi:Retrovirus-related Pol polyprotein from transposon 412 family [Cucumis melo var. makuwa]|uniref:Retrovirus-related Pol polyprotein from transposon 412 family n=1 Tax=Cucumis melo var. makuwa TaxID=1194695 RepID=A0A5A7TKC7_CUCMM|nr:Retrovirus-related Pol polyprotein from transposon 412 family [Cucumis melo var. makuwa]TYK29322.1 Retrovirus-related Pol polyprotein from transposon 412 family [Cucumis melo var. makuwa]
MGPFPQSGGHTYILLVMDYVPKWIEVVYCEKNDVMTVRKFLKKNILSRFGTARALINDEGGSLQPRNQENFGQSKNSSHKDWVNHLNLALWVAYRTAYKTTIGISPYAFFFEKVFHLPLKLEHKALWAYKKLIFDNHDVGKTRLLQLHELFQEWHSQAYENAKIYKEKMKA